jgi:transposase InsO family protein
MLKDWGIEASTNGVGTRYGNTPMESFFGTLKGEWVHHRTYRTRDRARTDLLCYIEAFYNRQRLHSALGYLSPAGYEQLYRQRADLS